MSVKKGKLCIENEPVVQKLKKTNRQVLLKLKKDEIDEIFKIPICPGKPITEGGSTFTGYVADVDSVEDVNKAYEQVCYQNLNVHHVICAFRLPGPVLPELQDYEDDDEHGAGKTLLDYMIKADIENRALFIVRNYDGTHIGVKCFDCIIDAAKWAVNYKPLNSIMNKYQFSWQKSM